MWQTFSVAGARIVSRINDFFPDGLLHYLLLQYVILGHRPVFFNLARLPRRIAAEFVGYDFGHLRCDLDAGAGVQEERPRSPRQDVLNRARHFPPYPQTTSPTKYGNLG